MLDKKPFEFTNAGVGTSFEDIGELILEPDRDLGVKTRARAIAFEVQNADASIALADFALLVKTHPNGSYHTLVSGSAWDDILGVGTPNTLAAASRALKIAPDLGPLYALKFQAKSASGNIWITVRGMYQ